MAVVALGAFLKSTQIYVAPSSPREVFLLLLLACQRGSARRCRSPGGRQATVFGHGRQELILRVVFGAFTQAQQHLNQP